MAVKIRDLKKSFPQPGGSTLPVLDGISFDVEDGEFVTLLGPSGCGKTTALKVLAGIERPDYGEVDLGSFCRGPLPIIWQEHRLFPWRTVIRNVTFPMELGEEPRNAMEHKARDLLKSVGLVEFADYYPWQISGGMIARVAIARALAANPGFVLMDEPFGSVDYQTKQELFAQVQDLRNARGLTVLYVTHDLRDAIQFSDRIVVLSQRPCRVRETVTPTTRDVPHSKLEERLWHLLK